MLLTNKIYLCFSSNQEKPHAEKYKAFRMIEFMTPAVSLRFRTSKIISAWILLFRMHSSELCEDDKEIKYFTKVGNVLSTWKEINFSRKPFNFGINYIK